MDTSKAALSQAEKIVLCATPFLKSSWGGFPNLRYREAHSKTGITRIEWDTAVDSLQEKGLLDKRKSLTVEGKAVINSTCKTQYRSMV